MIEIVQKHGEWRITYFDAGLGRENVWSKSGPYLTFGSQSEAKGYLDENRNEILKAVFSTNWNQDTESLATSGGKAVEAMAAADGENESNVWWRDNTWNSLTWIAIAFAGVFGVCIVGICSGMTGGGGSTSSSPSSISSPPSVTDKYTDPERYQRRVDAAAREYMRRTGQTPKTEQEQFRDALKELEDEYRRTGRVAPP